MKDEAKDFYTASLSAFSNHESAWTEDNKPNTDCD